MTEEDGDPATRERRMKEWINKINEKHERN